MVLSIISCRQVIYSSMPSSDSCAITWLERLLIYQYGNVQGMIGMFAPTLNAALIPVTGKQARRGWRAEPWTAFACRKTSAPWTWFRTELKSQPEEISSSPHLPRSLKSRRFQVSLEKVGCLPTRCVSLCRFDARLSCWDMPQHTSASSPAQRPLGTVPQHGVQDWAAGTSLRPLGARRNSRDKPETASTLLTHRRWRACIHQDLHLLLTNLLQYK